MTAIRSIVFCNGWFLNRAANKDPIALELCPVHISLMEKNGKTTTIFTRPTVTYRDSPAYEIIAEIEEEVIELINNGVR